MGNKMGSAPSIMNIGIFYKRQGNYPRALDYSNKLLIINEEIGALEQGKLSCQCLFDAYKAMG